MLQVLKQEHNYHATNQFSHADLKFVIKLITDGNDFQLLNYVKFYEFENFGQANMENTKLKKIISLGTLWINLCYRGKCVHSISFY